MAEDRDVWHEPGVATQPNADRGNSNQVFRTGVGEPGAQAVASELVVDGRWRICPTGRCPPVIGNVLLYRNGSHLTTTYIKTMAGKLRAALVAAGVPRR